MTPLTDPDPTRAVRVRAVVARRISEPAFWAIQAMVIGISVLHIALEADWIPLGEAASEAGIHHLPVVLYLVPVAYGSLSYGLEGGVLTSLWAGLLASFNVFLFNLEDYSWVVDLGFVVLVVGVGIITALPVERERRQRHRAEAAVRRLEALNELAEESLKARDPVEAVRTVLDRLSAILGVDDSAFVLWDRESEEPAVKVSQNQPSRIPGFNEDSAVLSPETLDTTPGVDYTRVEAGGYRGLIAIASRTGLADPEASSFLAAVGNQLATRVEIALLIEQEQTAWSTYVRLVTEAQEEERRRLARELHDGPAQHLAMLVRTLQGQPDLHGAATTILTELRRVARDQRPTLLDDLGVAPALDWLVTEGSKRSDLTMDLRVEGEPTRLSPESEVVLYRIAQEAMRNAEVHAHPTHILVTLRFLPGDVELTVSDDGSGFEAPNQPGEYVAAGRLGIMGMYERAQLVGGSLAITSAPGTGTVVVVTVPRGPVSHRAAIDRPPTTS